MISHNTAQQLNGLHTIVQVILCAINSLQVYHRRFGEVSLPPVVDRAKVV